MAAEALADASQYLTLTLSEELFALEISRVREVLELTKITRVPRNPDFVLGVMSLRGSIVAVVDLRQKFCMGATRPTVDTCIVISEIDVGGQTTVFGPLVDSVQKVIELDSTQIEPPPQVGTRLNNDFIQGMARSDGELLILLDIHPVFSAEELEVAKEAS